MIRFHVDQIEAVLAILKPYRRRQLSEAQKERLRAVGFQRHDEKSYTQGGHGEISGTNPGGSR